MADPFYLAQLTSVKNTIGGGIAEDTTGKYDVVVTQLMTEVTYQMQIYLNRIIQTQTNKIQYFDWLGYYTQLSLETFPIDTTATFSMWVDALRQFGSTSSYPALNYDVQSKSGIVRFNYPPLSYGYGVVKVQYSGGMGATTEEFASNYPDISGAFATEVAFRFQNRSTLGKIAVTVSGASVTTSQRGIFLPLVTDVLDMYRRV
jgi:hypothetical protein